MHKIEIKTLQNKRQVQLFQICFLFFHNCNLSTSLLDSRGLLNSLGVSVGLVNLGELGKSILLQVRSVVVISNGFLNGRNDFLESLVNGSLDDSNFGSSLGGGLGVKNSLVISSGGNSYSGRVADSRVLVGRDGTEVAFLNRETHSSRTLGASVDLLHEGVVVLYYFPDKLTRNHF